MFFYTPAYIYLESNDLKTFKKIDTPSNISNFVKINPPEFLLESFEILEAFKKDPANYILKVKKYELNISNIIEDIKSRLSNYSDIIQLDKIKITTESIYLDSEEAALKQPLHIFIKTNWKYLEIIGKDPIEFKITIQKLKYTNRIFFDSFRKVCKSDPMLHKMFLEIANIYLDETKHKMISFIHTYLN